MKRLIIISLILFLFAGLCFSETETRFSDDFGDYSKISTNSNILLINNIAKISDEGTNKSGYLVSTTIQKQSHEEWENLEVEYKKGTTALAGLIIHILDINTTNLIPKFERETESSSKTTDTFSIDSITNKSIKLKAIFNCGPIFPFTSPELYSWKITVKTSPPALYKGLYGFPAPLKIDDGDSKITFYYKFKKNCKATLKIYDTNYNLIRTFETKSYSVDDYLNVDWNGKNGNKIKVMSGVYIAILTIKNDDGKKEPPVDPFSFALIR